MSDDGEYFEAADAQLGDSAEAIAERYGTDAACYALLMNAAEYVRRYETMLEGE